MSGLSVAILTVGHDYYRDRMQQILCACNDPKILLDIPNLYIEEHKKFQDLIYWNL